jgi:hypothetical protein
MLRARFLTGWLVAFATAAIAPSGQADLIDFETLSTYSQGSGGQYYNGDLGTNTTNTQGWSSDGAHFSNAFTYDSAFDFSYWSGFSYSRVTNGTTGGFQNQYAARPGIGSQGSSQYAVVFNSSSGDAVVTFGATVNVQSMDVSNTAYAYFSMLNGDAFAKKFGGNTGNDADFFKLTIQGFQAGTQVGAVDFYLADYRFSDNSNDYLVSDWRTVGLSALGSVDSLRFALASSDNGTFGMNTPAYFAMDRIAFAAVPEPGSILLLAAASGTAMLVRWRRRRAMKRPSVDAS